MKNSYPILGISIAALLTVSVFMIAGAQEADAAKKWNFGKNTSFESDSCIITTWGDGVIQDCNVEAWLDKKGKALQYKIEISGMEWIDSNDDVSNDVWGSHIHDNTIGTPENPKGPHVLDAFGNPSFDDSDVVVQPAQGIVTGIWDASDVPWDLSANLDSLCDGDIFIAIHGFEEDVPHHKAPYAKMILEPTDDGEKLCEKLDY